jgi:hypothetical protein
MGIRSGFRKDFPEFKKSNIIINIGNDGVVTIYKQLNVKSDEDLEDLDVEITIKDAKKIRKDAKE